MECKSLEFLKNLINSSSPSGFEDSTSEMWRKYLSDFGIEVSRDFYGNSIARVGVPGSPKIMLCGHIDEVGFMVNYINDEGFIYISKIGGVDSSISLAQKVTIYSKKGPIPGVIGSKPIHLHDDEEEGVKIHNLFVDIGAIDKEDAMNFISVGDPITFDSEFSYLANNRIVGRGFDDRMGAWVVAEVIKRLHSEGCSAEVFAVATVQEENGLIGALMVRRSVQPDVAIAIDVTHSTDVPNLSKEKHGDVKMGGGPVLSIGSTVHKKVNMMLEDVANNQNIDIQKQISPGYTGTDADVIFLENGGIPSALVSVPNRYMHSPVEVIQLEDLEDTVKLITAWCKVINETTNWR